MKESGSGSLIDTADVNKQENYSEACLVQVRAQVMTRDVGMELWNPLRGGGMSIVSIARLTRLHPCRAVGDPCRAVGDPCRAVGNPCLDVGDPLRDVGDSNQDLGNPGQNAGNLGQDAGNLGQDAGNPDQDAGNPGQDAGNESSKEQYVIKGQRISDKAMLLDCVISNDLEYTLVNGTFHHWCMNGNKFGLTFQTSADATSFHRMIQTVMESFQQTAIRVFIGLPAKCEKETSDSTSLLRATADGVLGDLKAASADLYESRTSTTLSPGVSSLLPLIPEEPVTPPRRPITPHVSIKNGLSKQRVKTPPASPSRSFNFVPPPAAVPRSSSHVSTEPRMVMLSSYRNSEKIVSVEINPGGNWLHDRRRDHNERQMLVSNAPVPKREHSEPNYASSSYVQLSKSDPCAKNEYSAKHDYSYPMFDSIDRTFPPPPSEGIRESNTPPIRVPVRTSPRQKWTRSKGKRRSRSVGTKLRCVNCREYFNPEENRCGRCPDGPDRTLQFIDTISCCCCAQAALYHCGTEEDGEGPKDLWDCHAVKSCRSRTILAIVCLFMPCLWCYPLLRSCHSCGVRAQCCGARHEAER